MDLRAIVLSLVCGTIFENLIMSARDKAFPSNCKIDARTPDRSSLIELRKRHNFSEIVLGAGAGAGGGVAGMGRG